MVEFGCDIRLAIRFWNEGTVEKAFTGHRLVVDCGILASEFRGRNHETRTRRFLCFGVVLQRMHH